MSPELIILVEDDTNLRQSLTLILQRAGFIVVATDGVCDALDLLRSGTYHLIISDTNIQAAKKNLLMTILNDHPNLSIVFLANQSVTDSQKDERLLGAYYLVKPIAPELLLDTIKGVLGDKKNGYRIEESLPKSLALTKGTYR